MSRFAPINISKPQPKQIGDTYKYGFAKPTRDYVFKSRPGLSARVVEQISDYKSEPTWMREFRLKALVIFESKPTPTWGGNLGEIDFDSIYYYLRPTEKQERRWEDVPADIKDTFDRLGIPEAERKALAGVKAQYDSEVVYGSLKKVFEKQGVVFLGGFWKFVYGGFSPADAEGFSEQLREDSGWVEDLGFGSVH